MGNFNLDEYVQVNERIEKFYQKYPEGSIQTEITELNDKFVLFKAYAYRYPADARPATGHAMEREGSSYINKTSHVENGETSAVGRALAMLGFEIKKAICSREEVANAINNQKEDLKKQTPKTNEIEPVRENIAIKVWEMLMKLANNDNAVAINLLEQYSTFTNAKGETIQGKRSFKDMSDKQIRAIYGKLKKDLESK